MYKTKTKNTIGGININKEHCIGGQNIYKEHCIGGIHH